MDSKPVEYFIVCFHAWAYTRKIFRESRWHVELWCFGQIIGSPSFMNTVLKDFCIYISAEIADPTKRQRFRADVIKKMLGPIQLDAGQYRGGYDGHQVGEQEDVEVPHRRLRT
jgi:hypothetical protein